MSLDIHSKSVADVNSSQWLYLLRRRLLRWGRQNFRIFPWRDGASVYEIAVAEVLLKRTTATAAARVFPNFISIFPNIVVLADSDIEDIRKVLRPVGLYQQRAQSFKNMARYVCRSEGGRFPQSLQRLRKIPGLGEYSARAVMCFAFGTQTAIVDSNVERVFSRLFASSKHKLTAKGLQQTGDSLVPVGKSRQFNWAILDLAAAVCRYDRPRCEKCPLAEICDYGRSG